jgi:tetratricopeptide (TPR) repeat protein
MSIRDRVFRRWALLAAVSLVFACAGMTILIVKHHSAHPQPPAATSQVDERQKAPLMTGANRLLVGSAATNATGAEAGEDRVVALVTQGNQLLAGGNYVEAARKYEQAVAIEPGDEDLHYNLAIALAKLGKTEEAKKHYEEALQIFPDHAEAHNNLGNLLMKENKLQEAIEQFQKAVKIVPENASFHNNLGTAFGRQGKVAEAIKEFAEAIKLTPTYVEARVNLANASLAAGQVDEAVTQLKEALRLQPEFQPAIQAMQRVRQRQASGGVPK